MLSLSDLIEKDGRNELFSETLFLDEVGDKNSQLICNVVKSNSKISIRVLSDILEERNTKLFSKETEDFFEKDVSFFGDFSEEHARLETMESND